MTEDQIFHVITGGATLGYLIVGLLINNKMAQVQLAFQKAFGDIKNDITELRGDIESHGKEDTLNFKEVGRRLDNLERTNSNRVA